MKIYRSSFSLIGITAAIVLQGCGGGEEGGGTVSPKPPKELPFYPGELNACGNLVNDSDPTNAGGRCIKVASSSSGWVLYTSSPSQQVLDDWHPYYSSTFIHTENGITGPAGGTFPKLNNTERDDWCSYLANRAFGGRNNWVEANEDQLVTLRSTNNFDIYGELGWPAGSDYAGAATRSYPVKPGEQAQVDMLMNTDNSQGYGMSLTQYVSCISVR
ncbi:hypothetical protein EK599_07445 [Vibrio sp. T187]|uniref:hypothetical protein n=1 Tax=Vibrio TaxID=662 RepID=UPI0010C96C2B|nr:MULTISPECIES: hypothetical protein [Vibrio]MBW3695525.1 hypothetical protein [Vibrio sp. T187]